MAQLRRNLAFGTMAIGSRNGRRPNFPQKEMPHDKGFGAAIRGILGGNKKAKQIPRVSNPQFRNRPQFRGSPRILQDPRTKRVFTEYPGVAPARVPYYSYVRQPEPKKPSNIKKEARWAWNEIWGDWAKNKK